MRTKYNAQFLIEIDADGDYEAVEVAEKLEFELRVKYQFARLNLVNRQEGMEVEELFNAFTRNKRNK